MFSIGVCVFVGYLCCLILLLWFGFVVVVSDLPLVLLLGCLCDGCLIAIGRFGLIVCLSWAIVTLSVVINC